MEYFLLLVIGCTAGLLTGLIGASGVMVVVPALVILGYPASGAIGASLFIDTIASLVVAWTYYQSGNLNLKHGLWIALGSVVGAQVGSLVSPSIPDTGLSGAFGIFLLVSAAIFWFRGRKGIVPAAGGDQEESPPPRLLGALRANIVVSGLSLGFFVGVISGLLGAGGGVMILLILVFVMQYRLHEGIGTSTLIMAVTAASGAAGHALSSDLPLKAALLGAAGTLIGGRLAAVFANRVGEKLLSRVVAGVFVVLAVVMLAVR